jgi:DNA-binding Xre family transcriptional regulator
MTVKWKIKEYLETHGKTPYALWKASGISRTTIYAITGGKMDGLHFDTLSKLIAGLESITGQTVEVGDVLEVVRDGTA